MTLCWAEPRRQKPLITIHRYKKAWIRSRLSITLLGVTSLALGPTFLLGFLNPLETAWSAQDQTVYRLP